MKVFMITLCIAFIGLTVALPTKIGSTNNIEPRNEDLPEPKEGELVSQYLLCHCYNLIYYLMIQNYSTKCILFSFQERKKTYRERNDIFPKMNKWKNI